MLDSPAGEGGQGGRGSSDNPGIWTDELPRKIVTVEGTEAALVFPSVGDALTCAMLALLRGEDHLVSSTAIPQPMRHLFSHDLITLGIETTFVDPDKPRTWRQEIRANTRAIFVTNPPRPSAPLIDMRPMSLLAKEYGIALIVDSSNATPAEFHPMEHDADILVHSCTRYQGKLGDLHCGVVAGAAAYIEEVRRKMSIIT